MRRVLPLSVVLLLAACLGGSEGASPPAGEGSLTIRLVTATPTPPGPTATPTPIPEPTPTPTPTPSPALEVVSDFAQQGGLLLVRLHNAPPGDIALALAGTQYPMVREGDRAFAVVGIPISMAPGDYSLTASAGGRVVANASVSLAATAFPEEYLTLPAETASLLTDAAAVEEERRLLDAVYAGFTPRRLWSGPWQMPSQGPITNPFGLMRSINGGSLYPHSGTDFAADEGTPILAAAAGRVALARRLYLYGNSVVIDHGAGVFTSYNHLAGILVTEGQEVAAGQQIGTVGATGLVTGPHLHWEAIIHGIRVDPVLWTFRALEP